MLDEFTDALRMNPESQCRSIRFGVIGDFVTGTKLGYGEKERLLVLIKKLTNFPQSRRIRENSFGE